MITGRKGARKNERVKRKKRPREKEKGTRMSGDMETMKWRRKSDPSCEMKDELGWIHESVLGVSMSLIYQIIYTKTIDLTGLSKMV